MSGHEKKSRTVRVTGKSPIKAPPRVADPKGRSNHHEDDTSTSGTPDSSPSAKEEKDLNSAKADADIKDKKIAELEKEIAVLQDGFERERTELGHKLTNEAESSIFWQQRYSSLNQTFLKTDTDLRLLRHDIQLGKEDRDRDIKTRISSLMLDRDAFREAYNEAMGDLRGKEETVKELQDQVWKLKNFISTSSKMLEQVTDDGFGESMQRLGNGLQNWVITNFRRAKIGGLAYFIEDLRTRLLSVEALYVITDLVCHQDSCQRRQSFFFTFLPAPQHHSSYVLWHMC